MKKILLVLLLFGWGMLQAQKKFTLYNLTSYPVVVHPLFTSNTASGAFPRYQSKLNGTITIAPFATYIIENTTLTIDLIKFPFLSTGSTPSISSWDRTATSASTSSTIVQSYPAWRAGNTQVFFKLQVSSQGTQKTIGITSSGYPATLTSNGWTASYVLAGTATAPNYSVTIQ